MATLPKVFRRQEPLDASQAQDRSSESHASHQFTARKAAGGAERDPFQLRALPLQDVIFFSKKVDNSRLVREADPKTRSACWSAVGAAAVLLAMLTGALAPAAATKLAGYRLESLRAEERRLLDERKGLELQEAELLNPARLEILAKGQKLIPPTADQVVHLDGKPDGTVAMAK